MYKYHSIYHIFDIPLTGWSIYCSIKEREENLGIVVYHARVLLVQDVVDQLIRKSLS